MIEAREARVVEEAWTCDGHFDDDSGTRSEKRVDMVIRKLEGTKYEYCSSASYLHFLFAQ